MQHAIGTAVLSLVQGDITKQRAEALVTAANTQLRGGGGVDGAIHRAAGVELLQACRQVGGCPTGAAVLTPAFNLQAQGVNYIIHAVGPIWQGGRAGEAELLQSAYRQALQLADSAGCKSIAFPAISTGVYGYPLELAAEVAITTVVSYLEQMRPSIQQVLLVQFDSQSHVVFTKTLSTYQRR